MEHFTSKAYMVVTNIGGRHGQYGSSTSVVGVFNKEKTANQERDAFIKEWNKKQTVRSYMITDRQVTVVPISTNKVDEQILSQNYE